jgi:hypothetical protein
MQGRFFRRSLCPSLILVFLLFTGSQAFSQVDPAKEFLAGSRVKYSSLNNPKAKGLHITLEYPSSWLAMQGERPNIVQKFVSEAGKGLEMAIIQINELQKEKAPTSEELKEILQPDSMRDLLPANAKYISGKMTKLEGLPAGWIRYATEESRAGMSIKTIHEWYMVYFDYRIIKMFFSVAAPATREKELINSYNQFAPLFGLMANSLIIHSRYK